VLITVIVYKKAIDETYLYKEFVHLATCTGFSLAEFEVVLVAKEVIPEQRVVQERL
jgi:hypothetical protein